MRRVNFTAAVFGGLAALGALLACGTFGSDASSNLEDGGAEAALADALASDAIANGDALLGADADDGGPPPCEAKHVACATNCALSTLASNGDPAPLDDGYLHLALGPSDVFFALERKDGKGNLYRIRKDGSQGAADLIAKDIATIGPVSVGAGFVYFTSFDTTTNKTSVLRIPSVAAPCSPTCATPSVLVSDDVAFNARVPSTLLAVDDSVFVGSSNGAAVRVYPSGASTFATTRFNTVGSVPLAADPSWVYFGGAKDSTVQRVRHDGTFLATLASGVTSAEGGTFGGPLNLATNCSSVFVTELESPARIFAIPTGAGAPVTPIPLLTLATGGSLVAADAEYVYFTQPSGTYYQDMLRLRLTAGQIPQAVFAFGGGTAETMRGALVLDDTYLYWLDVNGNVRRMGK
jgi:hypothetical protein